MDLCTFIKKTCIVYIKVSLRKARYFSSSNRLDVEIAVETESADSGFAVESTQGKSILFKN
jgi:hypothetical protein